MSVVIEPSEQLEFHRPFTRTSKESLHVKNPSNEPIIFKVKTTAPKQYCVRPNAGRIEPNSEIEVQIILQPFKEDLPEDYKCKDKFLVQTAPINASFEQQDITSMWSHVETNDRSSMHQHKIKCAFVSPKEDEQVKESTIASSSVIDAVAATANTAAAVPALNLPPLPAATTSTSTYAEAVQAPAPLPVAAAPVAPVAAAPVVPVAAAPIAPVAATAAAPVQSREIPTEKPSLSTTSSALPTTSTTIKETASTEKKPSAAAAASTTDKELKEALEKIAKLEKELNNLKMEEGLRARNGGGRKLAPTVQPLDAVHQHLAALETPRPTEGYPPQVVMGVALLVFIFTYLFF